MDKRSGPGWAAVNTLRARGLVALALLLLMGCGERQDSPAWEDTHIDPGRAPFEQLALPETGILGSNPVDMAAALYGSPEPVEGHYTEKTTILSALPDRQVLLFTQLGLADDSLRGQRYRLEFLPGDDGWRLDWAGRQLTCWPGRGHQDWSTRFCN